ncbi:MAG TPA: metal ABC transporter permease [Alphaproteobacteria bacterium]|nr:metal ABC transporter permease [Alphaproteobacteria bacterium]
MLDYDFMRTAFAAGAIVAIVAGTVGVFLVLRNLSFAGHALSHVGFAGATGAALVGMSPLWGLVAFSLLGAAAMGLLGEKLRGRDVAVGIILSLALGCGVLFLHLYTAYASQATALLFGNVLGVGGATLRVLLALAIVSLAALAAIARPLIFATLEPELAEAKGVRLRLVSALFLAIVAIAVAEAAQVVGVLLVFALMVGPPAAALGLTTRLGHAVALSALLGLVETWAGIALAYVTDWPTSFWIVLLSCLVYFASLAARRIIALGSEGAAFP